MRTEAEWIERLLDDARSLVSSISAEKAEAEKPEVKRALDEAHIEARGCVRKLDMALAHARGEEIVT